MIGLVDKREWATLVLRALVITVSATAIAFAANAVRPNGLRIKAYEAPIACSGSPEPHSAPTTIAPLKAARLCGHKNVMILDARTPQRFAEGHVADAIHLPCSASDGVALAAIAGLAQATTVIVYGETTDDANAVASTLRKRLDQSKQVLVLEGGFAAWEKASLSCASGPCEGCAESSKAP